MAVDNRINTVLISETVPPGTNSSGLNPPVGELWIVKGLRLSPTGAGVDTFVPYGGIPRTILNFYSGGSYLHIYGGEISTEAPGRYVTGAYAFPIDVPPDLLVDIILKNGQYLSIYNATSAVVYYAIVQKIT